METKTIRIRPINNAVYSELGERWYEAEDDPIALLRAESRLRNPWVAAELDRRFGRHFGRAAKVLDIGCGAGFASNDLAARGHVVTGLDASAASLAVAAAHDRTKTVTYDCGDAYYLPYADGAFDAVCAMDFLEHVEEPARVIAEAARVLAPGGVFFFHTFNRNWLSWLVIIKGVEWFVKNVPADLHLLRLFIAPAALVAMMSGSGLELLELRGMRPQINGAFWRMLLTGRVSAEFKFVFTRSTLTGYTGVATKS